MPSTGLVIAAVILILIVLVWWWARRCLVSIAVTSAAFVKVKPPADSAAASGLSLFSALYQLEKTIVGAMPHVVATVTGTTTSKADPKQFVGRPITLVRGSREAGNYHASSVGTVASASRSGSVLTLVTNPYLAASDVFITAFAAPVTGAEVTLGLSAMF